MFAFLVRFKAAKAKRLGESGAALVEFGLLAPVLLLILLGTAQFGLDVYIPGMLTAVVARAPVFGGKVASFNAEKAKALVAMIAPRLK